MSYGIIYKVTNKKNGKIYIGQTIKTLADRKNSHLYTALRTKSKGRFQNAIRKYGSDSFIWEVICSADNTEELSELEKYHIVLNDSFKRGYNSTTGGEHPKWSEDSRKALSFSLRLNVEKQRVSKYGDRILGMIEIGCDIETIAWALEITGDMVLEIMDFMDISVPIAFYP